jgi:hypothetical protein
MAQRWWLRDQSIQTWMKWETWIEDENWLRISRIGSIRKCSWSSSRICSDSWVSEWNLNCMLNLFDFLIRFWFRHDIVNIVCLQRNFESYFRCFNMFQHVSTYFNIFQHISLYLNIFKHVSICLDMHEYVSICPNLSHNLSARLRIAFFDIFEHFLTYLNIFKHIWIYFSAELIHGMMISNCWELSQ